MSQSPPSRPTTPPPGPSRPRSNRWLAPVLAVLAAGGIGLGWVVGGGDRARSMLAADGGDELDGSSGEAEAGPTSVDVVLPERGGIARRTIQPGTVLAFESVDLFARVSGYLETQAVDIGAEVRAGQVLAEIDVPVEAKDVEEAEASLVRSRAQADQAKARIETAEADRDSALAAVAEAESAIDRHAANRALAEKQYERISDLSNRNAVSGRLVDEQARDRDAARAAERTAHASLATVRAQRVAAEAKIKQAEADAAEALAAVGVAQARLERSRAVLGFATIVAPFDGVVTRRNFHPGAFIRAASGGESLPLLTVARTDLMRVVIQVPDRDVVLADAGDPVVVTIDALSGQTFEGTVARLAESEDPTTRTMRVEVDLENPDRLLRAGMYGSATIVLRPPTEDLTLPTACLAGHSGRDAATIYVVRDGKAHLVPVKTGGDDGVRVEVTSGLAPDDQVVLRADAPLEEGMPVEASTAEGKPHA